MKSKIIVNTKRFLIKTLIFLLSGILIFNIVRFVFIILISIINLQTDFLNKPIGILILSVISTMIYHYYLEKKLTIDIH